MPIKFNGAILDSSSIIKYNETQLKKIIFNNVEVWNYDATAPALTVTAPTSTNSASPTTTTSASYTVSGTVSDTESGVAKVTVNGQNATISGTSWSCLINLAASTTTRITIIAYDNAGNTTTLVKYVRYIVPVYVYNKAIPRGTGVIWTNTTGTTQTIYATIECTEGDYSGSYIQLGVSTPSSSPNSYTVKAWRYNTVSGTLSVPNGYSVWTNEYYAYGYVTLYYYN